MAFCRCVSYLEEEGLRDLFPGDAFNQNVRGTRFLVLPFYECASFLSHVQGYLCACLLKAFLDSSRVMHGLCRLMSPGKGYGLSSHWSSFLGACLVGVKFSSSRYS